MIRLRAYVPIDPDAPIRPGLEEYVAVAIAGLYFLIFLFLCPKGDRHAD